GTLRLWSPEGEARKTLEGQVDRVLGALELRSGDILSWSFDGTLRLWSPEGEARKTLEGHSGWVAGALELGSGDILSWSEDGTLRLWSPEGEAAFIWIVPTSSRTAPFRLSYSGSIVVCAKTGPLICNFPPARERNLN
ncbi:MAG TPA: hypothetical protein PLS83_12390, partial [Methanothrix soehngenii]|nr:hypothetical protein [Methanothrix soehngenii]